MFAHFRRNWLSWMTLIILVLLFSSVEQIRNLFERPRLDSGASWIVVIGFYGFLAGLLLIYVLAGWWVVPFDQSRLSATPTGFSARVRGAVGQNRVLLAVFAAVIAVICGVAALLVDGAYLLDRTVLFSFTLLAITAAIVFATWQRLAIPTQRLLSRSLMVLVVLSLLGELLWYLGNEHELFSPRNYSLWAILHVFFCGFLFARVVDVWQSYNELPIRGFALVAAIVAVGLNSASNVGEVRASIAPNAVATAVEGSDSDAEQDLQRLPASDRWLEWMAARLNKIPSDGPVILVAASGGGSRAALFTALVYEDLEREVIPYGEAGKNYSPAEHVLMISSVSGGTLASSCYLDREYTKRRTTEKERAELRNSTREELLSLMKTELDRVKDLPWYRRVDSETGEVINFVELAKEDLEQTSTPWFLHCPFADDMCADFMAPLLRGVLHPGRDRAESVRRHWQLKFGLEETNLDWLKRGVPDPDQPISPVLLCNATEVDRGSRLIIGFPPLPPGFLSHGEERTARALVDLDSSHSVAAEVSLADATRISANFPWGFPIASTAIPQYDETNTEKQPDVHLIDGGVCDNTGVDSIRYVVEALAHWANLEIPDDRTDREAQIQRLRRSTSADILEELKERGVILLEIDSGAKPERPGTLARLLSGILEPVGAMQNAGYASAAAAFRTHLDSLDRTVPNPQSASLTDRITRLKLKSPGESNIEDLGVMNVVNVKRLTITCNHQENVMTAWALGPSDKAQIFVRFLVGKERLRHDISEFLEEYSSSRSALKELEMKVAALEGTEEFDSEALSEIIATRNDLVAISQAAQNLTDLRIGSEKMFYQGIALPEDVLKRVDDKVRTVPGWNKKLPRDVVPEMQSTSQDPSTPPEEASPQQTQKLNYERIQQSANEIERQLKERRRGTLERIKGI